MKMRKMLLLIFLMSIMIRLGELFISILITLLEMNGKIEQNSKKFQTSFFPLKKITAPKKRKKRLLQPLQLVLIQNRLLIVEFRVSFFYYSSHLVELISLIFDLKIMEQSLTEMGKYDLIFFLILSRD